MCDPTLAAGADCPGRNEAASPAAAVPAVRVIQRAYKTELDPNRTQARLLGRAAGAARFIYNRALAYCDAEREAERRRPSAQDLNRELTRWKADPDLHWLYELPNMMLQEEFRNLASSYEHAWRRWKEGKRGREVGWPRFKSRRRDRAAFTLRGPTRVEAARIKLPWARAGEPLGWVKLKEAGYLPAGYYTYSGSRDCWDGDVRVTAATVSERAGRWFVSLQCEVRLPVPPAPAGEAVGIDVGSHRLATSSDGGMVENPRALRKAEARLRRAQRTASRRMANRLVAYRGTKKVGEARRTERGDSWDCWLEDGTADGRAATLKTARRWLTVHAATQTIREEPLPGTRLSGRCRKTHDRVARLHYRIANIRRDAIHQATHKIVVDKLPVAVGIENLNVKGMMQNRRLAKSLADASMSEFLRQIRYKAAWHDILVVEADRWFASTQTCSRCGKAPASAEEKLTLSDRRFVCPSCGFEADRDLNAALNLRRVALEQYVAAKRAETQNASGGG